MRKRIIRKVYRLVNPIDHAIQGAAITPRKELDKLRLLELSSLDAILHGRGGLDEWNDLVAANNLSERMALMGVGKEEVLPVVKRCENHLVESARRFQDTGKMGFTGQAIQDLRDMLDYHDLQRSSVSRSVYEEAIRMVTAQIKSGHVSRNLWHELGAPAHG